MNSAKMSEALIQVLQRTVSQNPQDQKNALEFLQNAALQSFPTFVRELSAVLQSPNADRFVRQAAGLQLKNALKSKDEATRNDLLRRWLEIPTADRDFVKQNVVLTLGTENSRPSTAAQCVAAIACAELPAGLWQNIIDYLMTACTDASTTAQKKEACLETLGYICQEINPKVLEAQSNQILTAIVAGMSASDENNHLRLAATNALLNSIEFTQKNFENPNERNHIMQVVCSTTLSKDIHVKVVALQCLVRIMSIYYQAMEAYMRNALFPITVSAMRSSERDEALQGIEFWSNVCEEELALQMDAEEAQENGTVPEQISKHYAQGACSHVCPILLEKLTQQNEDDDECEWSPAKAAGVCLELFAQCVHDPIIECVLPFLKNFGSTNWRLKEAAIMAFGSILNGPDQAQLRHLCGQAIGPLVEAMNDQNVRVRDTAAWAIGRVCEYSSEVATDGTVLQQFLPAMYAGLNQEPRVSANICWALISLAKTAYEVASINGGTDSGGQPETYVLSSCFEAIINTLINVSERPDSNQANLRLAAYEALMELIKNSPADCYAIVQSTTIAILKKLELLLTMEAQANQQSDRAHVMDLQALLCATLQSVLRKMRPDDARELSQPMLNGLLQIMDRSHGRANNVMEEALYSLGTLIECLGQDFAQYLELVRPHILRGLQCFEDTAVCSAAIGVITDLCRALEAKVQPILDDVVLSLIQIMKDPRPSRDVKVSALSVVGDIAITIGPAFKRYFSPICEILQLATSSAIITDASDFGQVDYVHNLRENCIIAYTGIIQGLKPNEDTSEEELNALRGMLSNDVHHMIQMIHLTAETHPVASPDSVIAAAIGLIGDLVGIYGSHLSQAVDMHKVTSLITQGRRSRVAKTKSLSNWAAKELRKNEIPMTAS